MNVAVLGVGDAGREMARLCARGGSEVSIHAGDPSAAMDAIDTIERHLERADVRGVALDATTGLAAAVSDADLVVETTIDDAEQLGRRFAELEPLVDRETLVATSRGSLSVTTAARAPASPCRSPGLRPHPEGTDVVELVATEATTESTRDRAASFVEGLGATPLFVGDTPGPVSGRLAVALEVEAMRLLEASAAGVETVDELLVTGYDHAVGPLERADRVGLDRRPAPPQYLASDVGDRSHPHAVLVERVPVRHTVRHARDVFSTGPRHQPTPPAVHSPRLAQTT